MTTFFDPIKHRYFLNDRPVVSVTQVLRDLIPGWSASDWYLARGRSVHACAAFVARGKNFEYPPEIAGQVAALRQFFAEVKPTMAVVELSVYSLRNQYAGTLDILTHKPGTNELMVLDFKASLTRSVPFQVAAYAQAYEDQCGGNIKWGVGVEIGEDGKYRMGTIMDIRIYKRKFLALLSAYHSRRECGIKETKEDQ